MPSSAAIAASARLASGATTDLYLGESERAGTLVVLKVARDRLSEPDQPIDAFRRFLQEYEIAQRIASPGGGAPVRPRA